MEGEKQTNNNEITHIYHCVDGKSHEVKRFVVVVVVNMYLILRCQQATCFS